MVHSNRDILGCHSKEYAGVTEHLHSNGPTKLCCCIGSNGAVGAPQRIQRHKPDYSASQYPAADTPTMEQTAAREGDRSFSGKISDDRSLPAFPSVRRRRCLAGYQLRHSQASTCPHQHREGLYGAPSRRRPRSCLGQSRAAIPARASAQSRVLGPTFPCKRQPLWTAPQATAV